ncbi:MAG: RcnB family protein [Steroidobacteraceae bacterium]
MALASKISFVLALALAAGTVAFAQEHAEEHGRPAARPAAHGEPHAGPTHYQRVTEPAGWNNRPAAVDKGHYNHNYQAARSFKIGVYRHPAGWVAHRWAYGQVLPRAYWAAPYILADYWLFALDVPPVGYEWVRDDSDAILVNITTGEILQVEYGVFS